MAKFKVGDIISRYYYFHNFTFIALITSADEESYTYKFLAHNRKSMKSSSLTYGKKYIDKEWNLLSSSKLAKLLYE